MRLEPGILSKEESKTLEDRGKRGGPVRGKGIVSKKYIRKRPKIYNSQVGYDFLQYIRIVFHWATKRFEIKRPHLELLLFLYPTGFFSSELFIKVCRIHTITPKSLLKRMRVGGFIVIWRDRNARKREKRLYCLSDKAKKMCARIHKILDGAEKIPDEANPFLANDLAVDKYYINLIKGLNKRNQERIDLIKKEKASA